ncbi:hypothetical protein Lal_00028587 [Lupinus albus]|uniref:Putative pectinesterase inhibitor domain-containing protein n=1 Tax=Lupinus albus TaxID=3870 RepID=A0A6A5NNN7_LUPAL|nr:putative pectinesterase inhibitor domain-containing protein [Lupinus albus]KAE9592513.1 putative pectinesterase inhibitor domain-containing protein [Lupinus albus]KAF1884612.1 hypothetical protein Lal_00028493 [Lupinus albus]KAF1884703.1 hypothetical protein Lal_00028587 [Lupinus albus]
MNYSKVSYLLFTIFMIFISHSPMPASSQSLYESVCKETGQAAANCIQLLKANPQIVSAKNYRDLSKFIMELGITKGTQGQNVLLNLLKTNPSPAIRECANSDYTGTIGSLKSAIRELPVDLQTAEYDAHVSGDGPVNCATALKAAKINDPSFLNINNIVSLLCQVSYLSVKHIA